MIGHGASRGRQQSIRAPLSLTLSRWERGFVLVTLISFASFGGNRGTTGGALQVALVSPAPAVTPLTADTPVDTARLLLVHQLLCRVVEITRPGPTIVRLTPLPGIDVASITEALQRVNTANTSVRSLLAPVNGWTSGKTIDLQLKLPAPEFERTLCHPAFAIPLGPFRAKGAILESFDDQPSGRPFVDTVTLQSTDARTAERLFSQRRVQLVLGAATTEDVPQLFVTALVLGPQLEPLRTAIESTIDRADLARFFVPAPSGPSSSLVAGAPTPNKPAKPAPLAPPREITLTFDDSAAHERSIAQRLQVKLQPLGYRLALKPLPHDQVKTHAPLESEVTLQSFALPPSSTGALCLWLDLAGQRARIPSVLQQLASAPDLEAKARELSSQLGAQLPVIPLVTRGLGLSASKDVQHLSRDVLGLPRLDDVFLSVE